MSVSYNSTSQRPLHKMMHKLFILQVVNSRAQELQNVYHKNNNQIKSGPVVHRLLDPLNYPPTA